MQAEETAFVDPLTKAELEKCIAQLPDDQARLVLEFTRVLSRREVEHPLATTCASEPVLSRDWLRPEEEVAWADL